MIKCIISDMGNVFISFDNDIFFKKIADNTSLSQRDIAGLVSENFEILRSFDKGEISPAEFYNKAVRIFKSDFDYYRFFPGHKSCLWGYKNHLFCGCDIMSFDRGNSYRQDRYP